MTTAEAGRHESLCSVLSHRLEVVLESQQTVTAKYVATLQKTNYFPQISQSTMSLDREH
jgi:hypothetical protein